MIANLSTWNSSSFWRASNWYSFSVLANASELFCSNNNSSLYAFSAFCKRVVQGFLSSPSGGGGTPSVFFSTSIFINFLRDSSMCAFSRATSLSIALTWLTPLFIYLSKTLSAHESVIKPRDCLNPFNILAAPASISSKKPLSGPFFNISFFWSFNSDTFCWVCFISSNISKLSI